jgi:hypothetical protein
MPELSCENPSRSELQNYLNEHWRETEKVIQYFADEFGVDCRNLYAKLYDSILNSLYRLNEFPREDKFWFNTNNKPTIYKLTEFCRLRLKKNSEDTLALWTLLALAIQNGAVEDLWSVIIEKLIKYKELDSNTLIDIYLTGDITYSGEGKHSAKLLTDLNLINQSIPKLEQLAKSNNEIVSEWAESVLSEINKK